MAQREWWIAHRWGISRQPRFSDTAPLPDRRDNNGSYAALEVALDAAGAGIEPRSSAFVRYGVAEGRINEFDRFLGLGATYRGAIAARPEDELGLAFSHARVSAATRSVAAGVGTSRDTYEAASSDAAMADRARAKRGQVTDRLAGKRSTR